MSIKEDIKKVSLAICKAIDEDEAYIVETQFDKLMNQSREIAPLASEGRFTIPAEILNYAPIIVGFIGSIFADAAKDVLKEKLVKLWKRWSDNPESLDESDKQTLHKEMRRVIDNSKLSKNQRDQLTKAIDKVLKR